MLFADKNDLVKGYFCRNYNIFVVNSGHGFFNLRGLYREMDQTRKRGG
jgi:hypothetical protein